MNLPQRQFGMAAVASTSTHLAPPSAPSRKHSASSSQPSTLERMTSRKLFSRNRKPATPPPLPSSSDLTSSNDSAVDHSTSSPHRHSGEKVFSSRDTNLSTSALSTATNASRTSRFFRRFARQKAPPVPSLPPALVLDLDAGTAIPRTSDTIYTISADPNNAPPTAAAAIIAQSNAAYAAAETLPKPLGLQRKKMLEAMTNARLDVAQTRDLVRMCGVQIRERGLDTPGLFRPFRIAESQDRVNHIIQLFLLSIDISTYISVFPILPENALDRLTRSTNSESKSHLAREELDKELRYASPHDLVSVLKFGLRHLRLSPSDFNSTTSCSWYDPFVLSERESDYHPRAIADLLHPKLPIATAELLSETLDLMASVAAHAGSNHMPASALCKVVGFWLFGRVGVAHPPPTVDELVEGVNKAAGVAEHLLLAHIRSQAAVTYSMPRRLMDVGQGYRQNSRRDQ